MLKQSIRGRRLVQAGLAALATTLFLPTAASAVDCTASAGPGVDWTDCDKKLIILSGTDFSGATLINTNFTTTDLRDTNLEKADLEKATLVRASLAGSKAAGAKFDRVEGYRTNFSGMDGAGASFSSAEVQRSNFANAVLTGVNFTKAELGRADFTGADITGTSFALANLARANLAGAKFSGPIDFTSAFFFLTRIEGLDLSAATGMQQWQVDMSCGDDKTKLPSGLTAAAGWPCNSD